MSATPPDSPHSVPPEGVGDARRYQSLFDNNPDAIFTIDLARLIAGSNPAAETISGYRGTELLGRPARELVARGYAVRALRDLRRALRGQTVTDQMAIVHRTGQQVLLRLTLVPIVEAGKVTGVYAIARDITEEQRHAAERTALLARLTTAEQRSAFLADAGVLLAASLDYETTLTGLARLVVPQLADWCAIDIVNDEGGIRRLVGAADPAMQERLSALQRRFHTDMNNPALVARLLWVIRRGRSTFVPDVQPGHLVAFALDDDFLRQLQAVGISSFIRVPLTARGQALGAISFVYAGSGRRYTKSDLSLAEDLARRAGTAVDNARLFSEAQQAVRIRDEFLATASHDLRSPVTSIKAFTQFMQRRLTKGEPIAPEDLEGPLQAIDQAASRITAHLEELLDLSRLQAGRPLDLNRRPTDLITLVSQIVARQPTTAATPIRVEPRVPALLGMWDAVRLDRVIVNLLSNAVKYSVAGGEIAVVIDREAGTEGPRAVLRVRDHGLGISAADLPHIFERFFRGGNAVASVPGTGIGLAGARDIVSQHGGQITVDSTEGKGTTVTVWLPLEATGDRPPATA